jgi:hypothetical protein
MRRPYSVLLVGTFLAVAVVLGLSSIRPGVWATPSTMKVEDFGAYWTGTIVNCRGGNAYEPGSLHDLQRQIDPASVIPGQVWSPPWTFPVLAPFTLLDFATARWTWRFFQLGTILLSVTAVWRAYGGAPERLIWAWIAALAWYPTMQVVGLGQNSTVVLLGVAGGLGCWVSRYEITAGMAFSLTLVKPQNVYLLGVVAVVWAVDRKQWRPALGVVLGASLLTLAALALNPVVFAQYVEAFSDRPPEQFVPPTFGMALRLLFGNDRFWLSFVPMILGLLWGIGYYLRNRNDWSWEERLPVVLLVSFVTSPYGWIYDQVLLLIPITQLLAVTSAHQPKWFKPFLCVVAGLTLCCFVQHAAGYWEVTFLWHAPVVFVLYLIGRRALRKATLQITP